MWWNKQSLPEVITANFIEQLFDKTLSFSSRKLINDLNLRYRFLSVSERDAHILEVINFLRKYITPAVSARKPAWEKGWDQNMDDFIKSDLDLKELQPYYYRKGRSIMSLKGHYIYPEDRNFESRLLKIIYSILSEHYLDKYSNIRVRRWALL